MFQDFSLRVCACVCFLCQVSSLCLDQSGQSSSLLSSYWPNTHISKHWKTTERILSGTRSAGKRSKWEFRKGQTSVQTQKQAQGTAGDDIMITGGASITQSRVALGQMTKLVVFLSILVFCKFL